MSLAQRIWDHGPIPSHQNGEKIKPKWIDCLHVLAISIIMGPLAFIGACIGYKIDYKIELIKAQRARKLRSELPPEIRWQIAGFMGTKRCMNDKHKAEGKSDKYRAGAMLVEKKSATLTIDKFNENWAHIQDEKFLKELSICRKELLNPMMKDRIDNIFSLFEKANGEGFESEEYMNARKALRDLFQYMDENVKVSNFMYRNSPTVCELPEDGSIIEKFLLKNDYELECFFLSEFYGKNYSSIPVKNDGGSRGLSIPHLKSAEEIRKWMRNNDGQCRAVLMRMAPQIWKPGLLLHVNIEAAIPGL